MILKLKIYYFIYAFTFSYIQVTAQSVFEKVFLSSNNSPNEDECYKTLPLTGGNLVSIGLNDGFSFSQSNFYLRMSDQNGNELWTKVYTPGTEGRVADFCITPDSCIVMVFPNEIEDSLNQFVWNTTFNKVDLNGNLIYSKTYPFTFLTTGTSPPKIFTLSDSTLIFTSSEHLVKLNSSLDTIIIKHYSRGIAPSNMNSDLSELFIIKNQIITGVDSFILAFYNTQLDSVYSMSFDSSVYSYINYQSGWYPGNIHKDVFGSYYFFSTDLNTFNSIAFVKLDSSLQLQWIRFLSGQDLICLDFDIDSACVVFAGSRGIGNYESEGFIYKFNLFGDSLLYKTFSPLGGAYNEIQINQIKIYNDYFCLSGWVHSDTSVQKSYIAVTDTSFSFPVFLDEPNSTSNDVLVFPNPSADRFVVYSTSGQSIHRLILYSVTGERMKEIISNDSHKCELNVDELSPGLYYLYVQTDNTMKVKPIVIN